MLGITTIGQDTKPPGKWHNLGGNHFVDKAKGNHDREALDRNAF